MTYSLKNKIRISIVSFHALNRTLCQLLRFLFKFDNINLPPDILYLFTAVLSPRLLSVSKRSTLTISTAKMMTFHDGMCSRRVRGGFLPPHWCRGN